MELIEKPDDFSSRFSRWNAGEDLRTYPFVENRNAPFTPLKRALPLLNIALISAAGAFITGTESFDIDSRDGDMTFREIPVEVAASELSYAAKGYDPTAIRADRNCQIPIERLLEYQANAVIGQLNHVWWSVSSFTPNAVRVAEELTPALIERLIRYEVRAALFIPASRLAHQTLGIIARGVELAGIPTMNISVDPDLSDNIRPPRTAYYKGDFGSVAGKPNWPEYQLRVLDESIRWIETFDQPGARRLAVELQSAVEAARGER
jgi:D-proline reductase (dithiol) PrdB